MRPVAAKTLLLAGALALPRVASAACTDAAPCVDGEPLWLAPAAQRLALVSDTAAAESGVASGVLTVGFRFRPLVIAVPSPNAEGREVNAVSHATDATLGLQVGLGNRLELTLVLPAGLYQRGAGIKGVTHQAAPAIAEQSLHDPRLGFGAALPLRSQIFAAKLRLDLKLPLGNQDASNGERSFVSAPSVAFSAQQKRWFAGAELGLRLRRPAELLGNRIGSQALVALGAGYELPRPRLRFALEAYALPSLVRPTRVSYVAAEWLASTSFSPRALPALALGLGGGTGLPLSSDTAESFFALGVPRFRGMLFARYAPPAP